MTNIPVTHFFHIEGVPEALQKVILREMAANGAKNIVLTDAIINAILADGKKREFYIALAENAQVTYMDAHAPFGKYADLNCPVKELHKEKILRSILVLELAAQFGIKTITFHIGNPAFFPSSTLEELYKETLHTLEKLLPVAEEKKLVLCIENSWHPTSTGEKLLQIKEKFPTDALGFCYDCGHAHLAENKEAVNDPASALFQAYQELALPPQASMENTLELMLPHIVNCHLHDNDGITDSHKIPGNGSINWKKLMTTLAKAPRLQCIQNEVSEPFQPKASGNSSIRVMLEKFDSILQYM